MKRFFNNFLICLFAYLLIGGLFRPTPAYAQAWRDSSFGNEYDAADDQGEVNAGAYVDRATKGNMASITCMIMPLGPSQQGADDGLCTNDISKLLGLYNKSAIGGLSKYMAMMYSSPPADLALWIQDTGQSLGFIPKQTYAQGYPQGIGFSGLAPLLPIWKSFRNVAYLLLAVIMIVIGFMVMLRKKIDPKTVVTVQNALPRIILTLVLITFSYAIVGILIDFMYLILLIVVVILGTAQGLSPTEITTVQNWYVTEGMSRVFLTLWTQGNQTIPSILQFVFGSPWAPGTAAGVAGLGTLGTVIAIVLGASLANPLTWIPLAFTAGVALLFYFIFVVILLFAFLRIFFMLLSAYINIILSLLIGPFQILIDAIPGNNGFASWIANLVVNILVFPITVGLLMLGSILASSGVVQLWSPPLLSEGSQGSYGLSGVIALGILLSIPTIVNRFKEVLKVKAAVSVTSGFGQSISSPAATVMQAASFLFYAKQLGGGEVWRRITGGKEPQPQGATGSTKS